GLFHVEQEFYPVWRLAQRALKQRNSLIRHGKIRPGQLELWSREYARYGEQIDAMRRGYIEALVPRCRVILEAISPEVMAGLGLSYTRGWSKEASLENALMEGAERDLQQGFTRQGPHRADVRVTVGASAAADSLSRGQLKVLVAALYLAQAELLQSRTGKRSIFLVDDLAAELDRKHRKQLCGALERLGLQVFATCVEREDLLDCWSRLEDIQVFHVEQGQITPEASGNFQGN